MFPWDTWKNWAVNWMSWTGLKIREVVDVPLWLCKRMVPVAKQQQGRWKITKNHYITKAEWCCLRSSYRFGCFRFVYYFCILLPFSCLFAGGENDPILQVLQVGVFFYLCDTVAVDHILLVFVLPGTLMENDPISLTWLFCNQVTRSVQVQPARYFAWAGCFARCSPFKFLASHTRIARCRWGHRCFVFCLGFFGCKHWEPL